jgi:hypothetical protein
MKEFWRNNMHNLIYNQHGKSCEDRCVVGLFSGRVENLDIVKLILDGEVISMRKFAGEAVTVELFNFCPRCGQELNTFRQELDEKIAIRRVLKE